MSRSFVDPTAITAPFVDSLAALRRHSSLLARAHRFAWELRLLASAGEQRARVGDQTATFTVTTRSEHVRATTLGGEERPLEHLLADLDGDETVWDVGACIGTYACFISQALDAGTVVAMEPDPTNRHHLGGNLARNAPPARWTVLPVALADSAGTLGLQSSFTEAGGGHHYLDSDGDTPVETRTGTGLVERGVPAPDVVKIDVQGAELQVLEGLAGVLDGVETLYVECHEGKTERYGTDCATVEGYLRERGYTLDTLGTPSTRRSGVYFLRASR